MNDSPSKIAVVPKVSIDWYRSAPWWRLISHSLAISWRASHLGLCALALLATQALIGFSGWLFAPEPHHASISWVTPESQSETMTPWTLNPNQWLETLRIDPPQNDAQATDRATDLATESAASRQQRIESALSSQRRIVWFHPAPNSFIQVWRRYVSYPFHAMDGLTLRKSAYFLTNTLGLIALWAFVGGCLARRSVQELGMHITSPWINTLRWVAPRWQSIVWSVAMPLALVLLFCLVPLLLGWISNIPVLGQPVALVLMLPVALMGLGVGWVAGIALFGFSLATVSIVTEKQADAFDGMSRASAYAFQRPATLFLAVLVAEWTGHFGGSIVSIVLNTGYNIISQAFALGSFGRLGAMNSWLDGCFLGIVPLLITAFGFSFFWTASTAIYLVLRKDVDRAEFDLIDMGATLAPKSLPKLADSPQQTPKTETPANPADE
ncbi:MAG: hypothetical protein NTV29_11600 [Planctomycetota bacterium]|nr:hypothetical protein [Planctomycetota bacterium]